jgi:hypothetical protein
VCSRATMDVLVNRTVPVGFEVLTAVVIKTAILWDIAPCSPYMNRRFGGMYHIHLPGRKSAAQETSESRWLGRMSCQSG